MSEHSDEVSPEVVQPAPSSEEAPAAAEEIADLGSMEDDARAGWIKSAEWGPSLRVDLAAHHDIMARYYDEMGDILAAERERKLVAILRDVNVDPVTGESETVLGFSIKGDGLAISHLASLNLADPGVLTSGGVTHLVKLEKDGLWVNGDLAAKAADAGDASADAEGGRGTVFLAEQDASYSPYVLEASGLALDDNLIEMLVEKIVPVVAARIKESAAALAQPAPTQGEEGWGADVDNWGKEDAEPPAAASTEEDW